MSEITLHTAQLQKSYSAKITDFLGDFGVVYNYIHCIYYIFSTDIPFDSFSNVIM